MRILYSHRILSRDGQAVHLEALVAAFRDQGHEVLVVGPSSYDRDDFGGENGGLAVLRRLCPAAVCELLELAYNIPGIWRLLRAYRSFRPDIVYERYNLFFFGGLVLKGRYGVPFHLEINAPLAEERSDHGGLSLKRLALFLQRHVWRRADRAYPVSEVLASYLTKAGVREDAITVNHNGVDPADLASPPAQPLPDGSVVTLGFIGFLKSWHGVGGIISLMAGTLAGCNIRLVIGGDGPARSELERQVAGLGLTDKVQFLGVVPRDRLADVIGGFDIALQPAAVGYASPLKIFEYMALGRAIVAPDQPNIREILSHERNALLFEPGDFASLAKAIARLTADARLRRELGDTARRDLIARDHTWSGNARRIIAAASRDLRRRATKPITDAVMTGDAR